MAVIVERTPCIFQIVDPDDVSKCKRCTDGYYPDTERNKCIINDYWKDWYSRSKVVYASSCPAEGNPTAMFTVLLIYLIKALIQTLISDVIVT